MKRLYILLSISFTLTLINCKSSKAPTNLNVSTPALPVSITIQEKFSESTEGKHFVIVNISGNQLGKVHRLRMFNPDLNIGSCNVYRQLTVIRDFKTRAAALNFIERLERQKILDKIEKPIPISEKNYLRMGHCNSREYLEFHNKTFVNNTNEAMKQ